MEKNYVQEIWKHFFINNKKFALFSSMKWLKLTYFYYLPCLGLNVILSTDISLKKDILNVARLTIFKGVIYI
jgi:hypothetical protein